MGELVRGKAMSTSQTISAKHRLYGELLCAFANAKTSDEAGAVFKESVKKAFNYPSKELKGYPDDPFPTLEEFRRNEIEENENLNESQKTLIKNFIENHPSHLHYTYRAGSAGFRGLTDYYDISFKFQPIIYYSKKEEPYETQLQANVGTRGSQGREQDERGKWEDLGNDDKGYIKYKSSFEKEIDKVCKKNKLSEKESERFHRILHYYFEVLEPEHNHICRIQTELKNILDVLAGTKKFDALAVSALDKYEQLYSETNLNVSYIIANDHGGIKIEDCPPFIEESFLNRCDGCVHYNLQDYYDLTIIFCFFNFFRNENNQKYLKKCQLCGDFFIAADARRIKCYSSECIKKYEREKKRKQREDDPVTYL